MTTIKTLKSIQIEETSKTQRICDGCQQPFAFAEIANSSYDFQDTCVVTLNKIRYFKDLCPACILKLFPELAPKEVEASE